MRFQIDNVYLSKYQSEGVEYVIAHADTEAELKQVQPFLHQQGFKTHTEPVCVQGKVLCYCLEGERHVPTG